MADEQFYTILTNKGKAKIANATLLNSNVTLTTLKVGDGNGAYYNPTEEQTDLKNVVHTCQVGSISIDKKNPNWVVVETIIPGSVGGFIIREIGLFDTEGDMIAVGKYPETYKPVVANGASKDLNVRTIFEVSNAENVTLNINPSVIIATKEDINNLQEQITDNATQLKENVNNITSIKSDKTFMFCNLSATTIATEGVCKISSISINYANWFELTSDGKLKCLVSGKYRFYCKAYINTAPVGRYELQLRRNETAVEIEMVNVTTTGNTTNRVFMLINAQQDQIIDVYLNQTSGSSVTISPDARFSKIYIERIGDL